MKVVRWLKISEEVVAGPQCFSAISGKNTPFTTALPSKDTSIEFLHGRMCLVVFALVLTGIAGAYPYARCAHSSIICVKIFKSVAALGAITQPPLVYILAI